jgi:prevent-host-death family protein
MEVPAAEFKAHCLRLMDEVAAGGEPLTITKRGKAVARLVATEPPPARGSLFGYMAGSAEVVGDIVAEPMPAWQADSDAGDPKLADLPSPAADAGSR